MIPEMKRSNIISFLMLAAVFLLGTAGLRAQNYWQIINTDRYKRMSQFERVQYDKALQLLNSKQYRAAANEFDRYLAQYKDSEVLPYIKFLSGYALHLAKDRFKAITVYNEIIDFFPGEIDAAATALYYRGVAQFENGDYTKGMQTMKELLDDEDYSAHRVAASASLYMVENYWKSKKPLDAVRYLKKIFSEHRKDSPDAANYAKQMLMAYWSSIDGGMTEYSSWYTNTYAPEAAEKHIKPAQFKINMVNDMYGLVMHWNQNLLSPDMLMKYRVGKKGPDPVRELWTLFQNNKKFYEKMGAEWDFYLKELELIKRRKFISDAEFDKRIVTISEYIQKTPDDEKNKGRQQQRLGWLFNKLLEFNRDPQAAYVNSLIKSERTRMWNEYTLLSRKHDWDACLKQLDAIDAKFKDDAKKIGWERAGIHHYRLRKYDDAIKLYRAIGDPPATLWRVADCYRAKKDPQAAIRTYIEIENSFPDSGPQAAWARCTYYNELGEKKKSIAEARRILKVYPKTGYASQSHQHLERLGVDQTGLGVVDDEF